MKKIIISTIFTLLLANMLFSQSAKTVPRNAKLVYENNEVKIFQKGKAYYGRDLNGKPVKVVVAKSADTSNKNTENKKRSGALGEVKLPCSATRDSKGAYIFHPCKN